MKIKPRTFRNIDVRVGNRSFQLHADGTVYEKMQDTRRPIYETVEGVEGRFIIGYAVTLRRVRDQETLQAVYSAYGYTKTGEL